MSHYSKRGRNAAVMPPHADTAVSRGEDQKSTVGANKPGSRGLPCQPLERIAKWSSQDKFAIVLSLVE